MLPRSPGHPFYQRLNQVLGQYGFDAFVRENCAKFYAENGRPSVPPEVYFRMLMIGYFEGIPSERGIAWRCSDSLSLRDFLGYAIDRSTPDHSTLSVIRKRIDLETHQEIFTWVLKVLAQEGLVSGKTCGIDATTMEANAAMKSIVRRDTGEEYREFLVRLAKESGIETPTRADLERLDRKRPKKASNDDWTNPNDPDAKITKMKDGRTHLAHKDEHAVDMDSGAVLAVTVQGAHQGDTSTLGVTIERTRENLEELRKDEKTRDRIHAEPCSEVVADKGYHSNGTMVALEKEGIRSYVAEPDNGQRCWEGKEKERDAVYANRRRIRGERGRRLMRRRGELIERAFAHHLETGGMRRVWLRGHEKILKRLLIHVAGFNLGLVMRKLCGYGTPRSLQDLKNRLFGLVCALRCVLASWLAATMQNGVRLTQVSGQPALAVA